MKQLAKREEQIMHAIWKLKMAFIRDVIEELPEPKPHYNTIATIIKIVEKKGYLRSKKIGNTHMYEPVISLEEYRDRHLLDLKKNYFGNSFPRMLAHFAKDEKLSNDEVEELMKIIKSKK